MMTIHFTPRKPIKPLGRKGLLRGKKQTIIKEQNSNKQRVDIALILFLKVGRKAEKISISEKYDK